MSKPSRPPEPLEDLIPAEARAAIESAGGTFALEASTGDVVVAIRGMGIATLTRSPLGVQWSSHPFGRLCKQLIAYDRSLIQKREGGEVHGQILSIEPVLSAAAEARCRVGQRGGLASKVYSISHPAFGDFVRVTVPRGQSQVTGVSFSSPTEFIPLNWLVGMEEALVAARPEAPLVSASSAVPTGTGLPGRQGPTTSPTAKSIVTALWTAWFETRDPTTREFFFTYLSPGDPHDRHVARMKAMTEIAYVLGPFNRVRYVLARSSSIDRTAQAVLEGVEEGTPLIGFPPRLIETLKTPFAEREASATEAIAILKVLPSDQRAAVASVLALMVGFTLAKEGHGIEFRGQMRPDLQRIVAYLGLRDDEWEPTVMRWVAALIVQGYTSDDSPDSR